MRRQNQPRDRFFPFSVTCSKLSFEKQRFYGNFLVSSADTTPLDSDESARNVKKAKVKLCMTEVQSDSLLVRHLPKGRTIVRCRFSGLQPV